MRRSIWIVCWTGKAFYEGGDFLCHGSVAFNSMVKACFVIVKWQWMNWITPCVCNKIVLIISINFSFRCLCLTTSPENNLCRIMNYLTNLWITLLMFNRAYFWTHTECVPWLSDTFTSLSGCHPTILFQELGRFDESSMYHYAMGTFKEKNTVIIKPQFSAH